MADKLFTRGSVRGFSMWPNLIPGDILRAEDCSAENLIPGMIAVFPEPEENGDTVHRVVSVRNFSRFSIVVTEGDRSGRDEASRWFDKNSRLKMVTGVLRRGRYRPVTDFRVPEPLSPGFVVRLVCGIVRRMCW